MKETRAEEKERGQRFAKNELNLSHTVKLLFLGHLLS